MNLAGFLGQAFKKQVDLKVTSCWAIEGDDPQLALDAPGGQHPSRGLIVLSNLRYHNNMHPLRKAQSLVTTTKLAG